MRKLDNLVCLFITLSLFFFNMWSAFLNKVHYQCLNLFITFILFQVDFFRRIELETELSV